MQITDVKIRKTFTVGMVKAIASVTFDEMIAVHDVKVLELRDGRVIVAMPSRKDEQGIYRDVVHPINREARLMVENAVINAYNSKVNEHE